jgi:hypothetical protein
MFFFKKTTKLLIRFFLKFSGFLYLEVFNSSCISQLLQKWNIYSGISLSLSIPIFHISVNSRFCPPPENRTSFLFSSKDFNNNKKLQIGGWVNFSKIVVQLWKRYKNKKYLLAMWWTLKKLNLNNHIQYFIASVLSNV